MLTSEHFGLKQLAEIRNSKPCREAGEPMLGLIKPAQPRANIKAPRAIKS